MTRARTRAVDAAWYSVFFLSSFKFSVGDSAAECYYIRGRSDKYLAYKRKTKILEKWRFISQHSLLLARYTWPSDAPTSLTRLKNTFSRGLQSRPPWRRWPPHSTQISARWVTFSSLETKRSRTGPNLENTVNGAAEIAARFPFQKQESNHRPILLFFHFSKIRGHARFHTRSKQNYKSDSAEILTVAVYENVLHDSKFLLR